MLLVPQRELIPAPGISVRLPHLPHTPRRSRCPNGLGGGGNANNKEADKFRFGGPGPRDPLEDLKILFLRTLEEWWREIKPGGTIPPATNAASAARTVQARSRVDCGVVDGRGRISTVIGGGRGRSRRKNRKSAV